MTQLAQLNLLEGVPSGLAAARDAIDAVLRDRGLRSTTPETTAESLLRGAHASAVLAGSASSVDDVRAGAGDETAAAATRLSTELLSLVPVLRSAPLQALARMHAVLANGEGEMIAQPRSAEAAARLQQVGRLLGDREAGSALLLGAVVHAEIATAAPFETHNGLLARAAERLVLVTRGVDVKSLIVPEAGHLNLRAAYESNLLGYADGGRAGVHSWLLYVSEAYTQAAAASPVAD